LIIQGDFLLLFNTFSQYDYHPIRNPFFYVSSPVFLFTLYIGLFPNQIQNRFIGSVVKWIREKNLWDYLGYDAFLKYIIFLSMSESIILAMFHSGNLISEPLMVFPSLWWINEKFLVLVNSIFVVTALISLLILPRIESNYSLKLVGSNYQRKNNRKY
jgi:hypothetical protein